MGSITSIPSSVDAIKPFSYAGQRLAVPLPETVAWIEGNLSLSDLVDFSDLKWPGKNLTGWTFPGLSLQRKVKLNSLWWPTGASRFAIGHFLCTDTALDGIRSAIGSATTRPAFPLTILQVDGQGSVVRGINPLMYALPARPLSALCPGSKQLWLLTLVDERYFWWLKSSGALVVNTTTTWSQLINSIGSALGDMILADTIPAAYLSPSPLLTARYESLPMLLDAVAWTLGMRVVRSLDGTIRLLSVASSQGNITDNLTAFTRLQAGGSMRLGNANSQDGQDRGASLPSTVIVTFPQAGICSPELWTETVTLSSLSLAEFSGTVAVVSGAKTFHDTAKANLEGEILTPSNRSELTALAKRIASDWYRQQLSKIDLKLAGVCPWEMEGLSDSVEWVYLKDEVSTRIQRPPWNDLAEELLHESSCHLPTDEWFPAKILSGTNPYAWIEQEFTGSGGLGDRTDGRSGTETVNPAYELNGSVDVGAGSFVWMKCGNYNSGTGQQEYEFDKNAPMAAFTWIWSPLLLLTEDADDYDYTIYTKLPMTASTVGVHLTGLKAGTDGKALFIYNDPNAALLIDDAAAFPFTIDHHNVTDSAPGNQIFCPYGVDYVLQVGMFVQLEYRLANHPDTGGLEGWYIETEPYLVAKTFNNGTGDVSQTTGAYMPSGIPGQCYNIRVDQKSGLKGTANFPSPIPGGAYSFEISGQLAKYTHNGMVSNGQAEPGGVYQIFQGVKDFRTPGIDFPIRFSDFGYSSGGGFGMITDGGSGSSLAMCWTSGALVGTEALGNLALGGVYVDVTTSGEFHLSDGFYSVGRSIDYRQGFTLRGPTPAFDDGGHPTECIIRHANLAFTGGIMTGSAIGFGGTTITGTNTGASSSHSFNANYAITTVNINPNGDHITISGSTGGQPGDIVILSLTGNCTGTGGTSVLISDGAGGYVDCAVSDYLNSPPSPDTRPGAGSYSVFVNGFLIADHNTGNPNVRFSDLRGYIHGITLHGPVTGSETVYGSQQIDTAIANNAILNAMIGETLSPLIGGTGVANAALNTLTLGAPLELASHSTILRTTATTDITLPPSGTLVVGTNLVAGSGVTITASGANYVFSASAQLPEIARVATTANLTATYSNGTAGVGATLTNSGTLAAFTTDGVTAVVNDKVLVKNQTTKLQNGLYGVTTVGTGAVAWVLTRDATYDQPSEIQAGTSVFVKEGTVCAGCIFYETDVVAAVGTDPIEFSPVAFTMPTITLSGHVTGSGTTSIVCTIPSSTITNAMMAEVLSGANGGTNVANTGKSITLGGNLTTSGAFALTLTVTAATNVTFPTSGTLLANSRLVSTGTGLSGGGNLSADRTISLANTAVTAGTYGDATHSVTITVDAQGRLTAATGPAITFPGGITGFAAPANKVALSALAAGMATTGLRSDCTFQIDITIVPSWTGVHTFQHDNIPGGFSTPQQKQVILLNAHAAAAGAQQASPTLILSGRGWRTSGGGASEECSAGIWLEPGQGVSHPTASFVIGLNQLGAGVTDWNQVFAIDSGTGAITLGEWRALPIGAQWGGTGLDTHTLTGLPMVASGVWAITNPSPGIMKWLGGTYTTLTGGFDITADTTGTLPSGRGGTGKTVWAPGSILMGAVDGTITSLPLTAAPAGQCLIGSTSSSSGAWGACGFDPVYNKVGSIGLSDTGTGYLSAPTISFNNANTGGTGATATATIFGGKVSSVTITNGGSGYTNMPVPIFSQPGGYATAQASCTITAGVVTAVNVIAGGVGYPTTPQVYVFDQYTGATHQALITANLTGGAVTSFNIVNGGSGYTAPPILSLPPPFSPGALTAIWGNLTPAMMPIDPATPYPRWVAVPAHSNTAGEKNDFASDSTYFYWCYATNAWARIAWTDVSW